jgi:hypothetical protein
MKHFFAIIAKNIAIIAKKCYLFLGFFPINHRGNARHGKAAKKT